MDCVVIKVFIKDCEPIHNEMQHQMTRMENRLMFFRTSGLSDFGFAIEEHTDSSMKTCCEMSEAFSQFQ
jgi:hypothetical protein